jgi:hypothetical protein
VKATRPFLLLSFPFGMLILGCASKAPGVVDGTVSGATVEPLGPIKSRIAAIPNAKITVRNLSTHAAATAWTDSNGNFRMESLAPGRYELSFAAKPFASQVHTIDVKAGETSDASTRLLTEAVDVSGCPPRSVGGFETPDVSGTDIRLSRACRGRCPVYSVELHGDGRLEYKGERDVSSLGSKTYRVNPSDVAALARQFFEKGFFNFCAAYVELTPGQSTVETTTTTIKIGGYAQTVSVYGGAAPQGLEELDAQIDRVAHVHEFVK